MREVKIRASREYNVYINSGGDNIGPILERHKVKRIFIITDENVFDLHKSFIDKLGNRTIGIKVIKPGEESKSVDLILDIYKELIKCNADRKTAIAAIGGGVVGDVSGFAASTFMRGLNVIHIPTTLLAQCDSSIGGKTGFNFMNIKNIIGTFYQPLLVYIDVHFLKTLSDREYISGLAEVIKYGFACDKNLFHYVEENKLGIKEREMDKLFHIVNQCVKIKGELIEKDEYDHGLRQVLNFGHTIGHGIESINKFRLSHGEAVAVGMNLEAYMAFRMGYISEIEYKRLANIIKYFGLPTAVEGINIDELLQFMSKDKKKISDGIKFSLPETIGSAIILKEIKQNIIKESILEAIRRQL